MKCRQSGSSRPFSHEGRLGKRSIDLREGGEVVHDDNAAVSINDRSSICERQAAGHAVDHGQLAWLGAAADTPKAARLSFDVERRDVSNYFP